MILLHAGVPHTLRGRKVPQNKRILNAKIKLEHEWFWVNCEYSVQERNLENETEKFSSLIL